MEKIELLAKFLEIEDLDQIEESSYDSNLFTVNPHTKKFGDSPEDKLEKVNLVKKALADSGVSNVITLDSEDFTPNMYSTLQHIFYSKCEELTKIGIHDLVNTLYFLCGGSKGQEFTARDDKRSLVYTQEYRDLYAGKEIEDTREESEVSDGEYLILDDCEADEKFEEYCKSYIDDCMEIPENIRHYFDEEKFIEDCRISDGRGHSLASYDGCEHEIKDPDSEEWFYIYRTN